MPTNARTASSTPTRMTRRFDRFTSISLRARMMTIRPCSLSARCDCGQQSTGQPQPGSTGLIGYAPLVPQRRRPRQSVPVRATEAPGIPGASACLAMPGWAQVPCRLSPTFWKIWLTIGPRKMQGDDHDDRNEGQKQTVLDERLAFLVLAAKLGEKSADELNHSLRYLLSLEIWPRQRRGPLAGMNMTRWSQIRSLSRMRTFRAAPAGCQEAPEPRIRVRGIRCRAAAARPACLVPEEDDECRRGYPPTTDPAD